MSDIVKRLRFRADENYEMLGNIHEPLLEAADEIERLREWNAEIALNSREFAAENEKLRASLERLHGLTSGIVKGYIEGTLKGIKDER